MLDLSKEERTTLARLERSDALIYRQAEVFALVIGGYYVCDLNTKTVKSLIERGAIIELGQDTQKDDDEWIYAADPRCFSPMVTVNNNQSPS